jgi:Type II secretory pathway, component PulJ
MKKCGRNGFTLVEIVLASTLLALLTVLICTVIFGLTRTVRQNASLAKMDRDADMALSSISSTLRTAILPITTPNAVDAVPKVLNDVQIGFGSNGEEWLDVLRRGCDLIAFTTPVDYGGDGDALDADMIVELGITLPNGTDVPGGRYNVWTGDNRLIGAGSNINVHLAAIQPGADLDMEHNNTDLNLAASRLAETFPPASLTTPAGYGIIRFAPHYVNSAQFIVSESDLGYDLNEDGDTDDTFLLGRIELFYANWTRTGVNSWAPQGNPFVKPLTGNTVLLQINQTDDAWTPIFKMVGYSTTNSINMEQYDESNASGDFALLVRLLMCDSESQGNDPHSFGRKTRAITRKYETVVKMRNLVTK